MTKIIKNIDVTVKYTVGLQEVQVDDDVYEELMNASDEMRIVDECKYPKAMNWLNNNIEEGDCGHWECEIEEIEEQEQFDSRTGTSRK